MRFRSQTIEYWLKHLGNAGVPCSPIMDISQVFSDEHSLERESIWTLDDGSSSVASAFRFFSSTPATSGRPPPRLDEHRDEIIHDWLS